MNLKTVMLNQTWRLTLVIPAFGGRLRKEDREFQADLGCITRLYLKTTTTNNFWLAESGDDRLLLAGGNRRCCCHSPVQPPQTKVC
jgi:hypothetical protein